MWVSAIGQIDDVRDAVTLEPKAAGDVVFLLGSTADETGGSEYLRYLGERDGRDAGPAEPRPYVGNKAPRLDTQATLPLYRALEAAIADGRVRSAATAARGGWALALARCVIASGLGLQVDLGIEAEATGLAPDTFLFTGLSCRRVGSVTAEARLRVRGADGVWVDLDLPRLAAAFKETLADE